MFQPGNRLRLAFATRRVTLVCPEVRRYHLERDVAQQPGIQGTVDASHAPRAKQLLNPIFVYLSANQYVGGSCHLSFLTRLHVGKFSLLVCCPISILFEMGQIARRLRTGMMTISRYGQRKPVRRMETANQCPLKAGTTAKYSLVRGIFRQIGIEGEAIAGNSAYRFATLRIKRRACFAPVFVKFISAWLEPWPLASCRLLPLSTRFRR